MPYALPQTLKAQAKEIARALYVSPEGRSRIKHTERIWQYRTYQGTDPVTAIDWKQSGRTRDLVVRQHEPIATRKIFFWSCLDRELPHIQELASLIFLSMAHMLVKSERTIGWLGMDFPESNTPAMVDPLFERCLSRDPGVLESHNIRRAILILCINSSALTRNFYDTLRLYAAQGNDCILFDMSNSPHPESSVLYRKVWPVYALKPDTNLTELLPKILGEVLLLSR